MLNMGMGFVFNAQDLASGAIGNLKRNFMSLDRQVGLGTERIQSSFQQLGVGMGLLGAGAIMVGGAFALANVAGEFEQAIAAVAAVSGATADELFQLKEAAIQAGIATQYSPTEAVQGLKELSQAGYSATESIKLLLPVLDLAGGSLGELSPQQAAGLASQALKAFGIEADNSAIAVDQMLQAVNQFALNASELPQALGIASRGAQSLKQSLSETLITLGLVKNIIPGVERASTGVAVAMERMADTKVQKSLKELNVEVVNSDGKFRDFLDIVGDMVPELNKMTDAKRASFLIDTFGAHALGSMQAVMTQVTNGIKTNTGVTLKGADAVKYLRDQFDNAGGTAANFRDKMLDTFAGQKKLLSGSMQTLAIVMGEPFAAVFKPIIGGVVVLVNRVLAVFKAMPMPVRKAFAGFVVGTGVVLSLVGALIASKAAIGLAVIGLKALGLTFGGLFATMMPALGLFLLLALAVAGFLTAYRKNVGGIADFSNRLWENVKLGFQGFVQLFEQGGFSGAVKDELNRTSDTGLKSFLISVYVWVERIRNFFRGIGAGFKEGVAAAAPALDALDKAFTRLGLTLGFVNSKNNPAESLSKWQRFGEIGAMVGRGLATVFEWLVTVMTWVIKIADGVAEKWHWVTDSVEIVRLALVQLGEQFGDSFDYLLESIGITKSSGDGWRMLGNIIAGVVGFVVMLVGVLVSIISAGVALISSAIQIVIGVFQGLADIFTGIVFIIGGIINGSWTDIWTGMKLVAFGVIDSIVGAIYELAGAIAGIIDSLGGLVGAEFKFQNSVRAAKDAEHSLNLKNFGVENLSASGPRPVTTPNVPATGSPVTVAPAAAIASLPSSMLYSAQQPSQTTVIQKSENTINLNVDGQKLASVVHSSDQDAAGRAFSPVPSY